MRIGKLKSGASAGSAGKRWLPPADAVASPRLPDSSWAANINFSGFLQLAVVSQTIALISGCEIGQSSNASFLVGRDSIRLAPSCDGSVCLKRRGLERALVPLAFLFPSRDRSDVPGSQTLNPNHPTMVSAILSSNLKRTSSPISSGVI